MDEIDHAWIGVASVPTINPPAKAKPQGDGVSKPKVMPVLIRFDRTTGAAQNTPNTIEEQRKSNRSMEPSTTIELPWKAWAGSDMAHDQMWQDVASRAAMQVLHMLHTRNQYDNMPIAIVADASELQSRGKVGDVRVVTTEPVVAGQLWLAPCAVKPTSLRADSTHIRRVAIEVQIDPAPVVASRDTSAVADDAALSISTDSDAKRRRAGSKSTPDSKSTLDGKIDNPKAVGATTTVPVKSVEHPTKVAEPPPPCVLYVTPEWAPPGLKEGEDDKTMTWEWAGNEAMHPFWTVRRWTPPAPGQKMQAGGGPPTQHGIDTKLAREDCNMAFHSLAFTTISVGCVSGVSTSFTTKVTVPFLTNSKPIAEGNELVAEGRIPTPKVTSKTLTWRDSLAPPTAKIKGGHQLSHPTKHKGGAPAMNLNNPAGLHGVKAPPKAKIQSPPPKGAPLVKAVQL